ncbi:MAG: RagB/SusD family nutrient uptake outer membrane protein [Bacteroidales bacterium]
MIRKKILFPEMKTVFIVGFFSVSIFLLTSCEDFFDNIQPIGQQTEADQFATQEGAELVLLGAYNAQAMYELDLYVLDVYGDLGMGLSVSAPSWHSAIKGNFLPSESGGIWYRYYAKIRDCNYFIKNVDAYDTKFVPQSRREEAIAEARTLRAMYYFMLVQMFGDVPLIDETNFTELFPSRTPVEDVYGFIIEDLEYGTENLPDYYPIGILSDVSEREWGRVVKASANALLAKVLMTAPDPLTDHSRASDLLQRVIDDSRFHLLDNWGDVFNPAYRADNPESLIPIMNTNSFQGGGSKLAHYATFEQTWFRPTAEMYAFYDTTDIRRDSSINQIIRRVRIDNQFTWDTIYLLNKYMQGLSGDERDNHPQYIMRYPEVLLLKAEALTRLNFEANKSQAVNLLNDVRMRANAVLADENTITGQDEMFDLIMDEYHKELFFEFNTWMTFKRFGMEKCFERQDIAYTPENEYKILLPLPSNELLRNPNLTQNTGYSSE